MSRYIVFIFSVVLLALSCFYSVKYVGIQEEELTDFTAALALKNNDEMFYGLSFKGRHIPLVTTPYQGPWKCWFVTPFTYIFESTVLYSRAFNIIFALIYLLSMYWAISFIKNKFAYLVFLIPFWDSKFLFFAPYDFGPLLFQMIFIALSLGCIFRFLVNKKIRWWFLGNLMIGGILGQKLTSISVFAGLIFVNTFLYVKYVLLVKMNLIRLKEITFGAILVLLPNLPFVIYFIRGGLSDMLGMTASSEIINLKTYFPKLYLIIKGFLFSMSGNEWIESLTINHEMAKSINFFGLYSLLVILICFVLLKINKSINYIWKTLYSVLILNILLFTAVRGLNRPWHFFTLEPIWMFAYIFSLIKLIESSKIDRVYVRRIFLLIIPILVIIYSNIIMFQNIKKYKGAVLASPITAGVTNKLLEIGAKKIYGLNFSVNIPVYYLSGGRIKGENLTWTSLDGNTLMKYIEITKSEQNTYLVGRHSDKYFWSKNWISWLNRDDELVDFYKNIEKYPVKVDIISDNNGSTYYIIKGI